MKAFTVLLSALLATALVAGCGGKSENTSTTQTTGTGGSGTGGGNQAPVALQPVTIGWGLPANDLTKDFSGSVPANASKITVACAVNATGPGAVLNGGHVTVRAKSGTTQKDWTIADVTADPASTAGQSKGSCPSTDLANPAAGAYNVSVSGTGANIEAIVSFKYTPALNATPSPTPTSGTPTPSMEQVFVLAEGQSFEFTIDGARAEAETARRV